MNNVELVRKKIVELQAQFQEWALAENILDPGEIFTLKIEFTRVITEIIEAKTFSDVTGNHDESILKMKTVDFFVHKRLFEIASNNIASRIKMAFRNLSETHRNSDLPQVITVEDFVTKIDKELFLRRVKNCGKGSVGVIEKVLANSGIKWD